MGDKVHRVLFALKKQYMMENIYNRTEEMTNSKFCQMLPADCSN